MTAPGRHTPTRFTNHMSHSFVLKRVFILNINQIRLVCSWQHPPNLGGFKDWFLTCRTCSLLLSEGSILSHPHTGTQADGAATICNVAWLYAKKAHSSLNFCSYSLAKAYHQTRLSQPGHVHDVIKIRIFMNSPMTLPKVRSIPARRG